MKPDFNHMCIHIPIITQHNHGNHLGLMSLLFFCASEKALGTGVRPNAITISLVVAWKCVQIHPNGCPKVHSTLPQFR